MGTANGVQTGRYEDTWIHSDEWKREAWFGNGHLVKSQSAEKHYVLAEGSQSGMLRMLMQILEPIPAEDTMTESDWRMKRDSVDGVKTIRVFRGPEGPNGELEPGKSQAYWFDDGGHLVKCYMSGFEVRLSARGDYAGVQVAHRLDVLKDGSVGMRVTVKDIAAADPALAKRFKTERARMAAGLYCRGAVANAPDGEPLTSRISLPSPSVPSAPLRFWLALQAIVDVSLPTSLRIAYLGDHPWRLRLRWIEHVVTG